MKCSALPVLAVLGTAAAGLPQLSINIQDGSFDDLGGLDPILSWSADAKVGGIDLTYGIEAAARPTADIASLPRKIWGTASTRVGDWGVTAHADVDAGDMSSADLEIDAANDDADLSVHLEAKAADSFTVNKIEATKGINGNDSRITVTPRYDLNTEEGDVVVAYSTGDTEVEVTASNDAQSVTISHRINDENRISPTISSGGDILVEWERKVGDDGSVTTTVKPDESINVEWKDAGWTTNINMPIDGADITGANVGIKKEVTF